MSYRIPSVPFVVTRRQRLTAALIAHGAGIASAMGVYGLAALISQLKVHLSIWLAGAVVVAVAGMLAAAVSLRVVRFWPAALLGRPLRQTVAGIAEGLLISASLLGVFWLDGQAISVAAGLWILAGLLLVSIASLMAVCRYLGRIQQRKDVQ